MNFFEQQAKAQKQTKLLIGLFLLAVIMIVAAINAIFYFALASQSINVSSDWFSQPYWIYISFGTIGLIIVTSLFRTWQINSNPTAIIKMVDASYVSMDTKDPNEKQLVNLVEEMAIASGMPIPQIFIMKKEQGLNAFVSGLKPSAAILVVTQGLLDQLTRQQMQGVIGHEFSHILNGDMRLNLRLMGIIAGILIIGQIGQVILRSGSRSRRSYSSFRSSGSKKNGGGIAAIGLGLFVVGYIGLFFGRIIKAAISRQREYLADASAVQFTRDRSGIAGALLSIKKATEGSLLGSGSAEELSHMCFGATTKISHKLNGWLASHPPLDERIQAVYPGFIRMQSNDNKSTHTASHRSNNESTTSTAEFHSSSQFHNSSISSFAQPISKKATSAHSGIAFSISNQIGKTSLENIERAQKLIHQLPTNLVLIARGASSSMTPYQFLLWLFLVANEANMNSEVLSLILENDLDLNSRDMFDDIDKLDRPSRHALFDFAMARISQIPPLQKEKLFETTKEITKKCGRLTPNGLAIYAAIGNNANPAKPHQKQFNRYSSVKQSINDFFYQLIQFNDYTKTQWANSEEHLSSILKGFGVQKSPVENKFDARRFHKALNQLDQLNPLLKQELVLNVVDAIQVDNTVDGAEYDFLRLLCEYLDCPIPLE